MKIVELRTENIKKIKVVHITPDGNTILIGGKNAQGKSSVLDSIMFALGGVKSIQDDPIREGQKRADIFIDLGELVVTRKFNKNGSTIKVEGKDGKKIDSPQKILDDLIGDLSFDPIKFLNMKPKQQADTLMGFCDFDFEKNLQETRDAFVLRADANSDVESLNNQIEASKFDKEAPELEVDVTALFEEIEKAKTHNSDLGNLQSQSETLSANVIVRQKDNDHVDEEMEKLKALKIKNTEQIKGWEKDRDGLQDQIKAFQPMDVNSLLEKMAKASDTNKAVQAKKDHAILVERQQEAVKIARKRTDVLEGHRKARLKAVEDSDLPVACLTFDSDGVQFNGRPLDQASSAEVLEISVAIGQAQNPDLSLLLVREGPSLDEDNLKLLSQMADKRNFQVWVERVGTTDKGAIIMEDGSVKE